jgi:signal transduction histidine kinase
MPIRPAQDTTDGSPAARVERPFPAGVSRVSWRLVLGLWTAYGVLGSVQEDLWGYISGQPISIWTGLAMQLPTAWCWAALTPAVLWLGRRLPLRGRGWPVRAFVHLLIATAIFFLISVFFNAYGPIVNPGFAGGTLLATRSVRTFVFFFAEDSMLYFAILAFGLAADEAAAARARELQQSELAAQLATARLSALKMQLHPHFLFNTLHTVGALVRTGDRDSAVQVVAQLGDLLRTVLESAMTQEVPLGKELEFIRGYLEIERIRFRDRLSVQWDLQSDLLDASVPHLILQPLVENALRHGIAPQERAGVLVIAAQAWNGVLELAVTDNGAGLADGPPASTTGGVGLQNTRLRLHQLYGAAASLEVTNAPRGGVRARLWLPLRMGPRGGGDS